MADLNVVYRIAADISGLQDGVNRAASSTERLEGTVTSVGKALLGAFSGTAVLTAIRTQIVETLKYADTLSNLNVATGVSISGLQRLEAIGITSSVSMETLARAVNALHRNLDDKDAQKALRDMGLNYELLRRLSPEEQFLTIARAVSEIEDPVKKANAGAALFNKTWEQIAPAINKDIDSIIQNVRTLSDRQIEATDDIGDEWDLFFLNFSKGMKGFIADIAAGDKAMNEAGFRLSKPEAPFQFPKTPPSPLRIGGGATVNDVVDPTMISNLRVYGQTLDETNAKTAAKVKADAEAAEASKKHAQAVNESLEQIRYGYFLLGQSAVTASQNVSGFNIRTSEAVAINNDYSRQLTESTIKTDSFGHVLQTNVMPSLQGVGGELHQNALQLAVNTTEVVTLRDQLDVLSDAFARMGQIGGKGLSDITRGIGLAVNSMSLAIDSVSTLKSGFGSLGAGSTLKGIASITSGIGGIVSVASAAIGAVKSLWNWAKGGEEGTQVNPARDQWFGGRSVQDIGDQLAEFGVSGESARQMIEKVFQSKTMRDFTAHRDEIDRILGGARPMALGGLVRQPTFAMVGESGPELVTPLKDLGSMGPIGGGRQLQAIEGTLMALRGDLSADRRMMPHMMITAWKDALAQMGHS